LHDAFDASSVTTVRIHFGIWIASKYAFNPFNKIRLEGNVSLTPIKMHSRQMAGCEQRRADRVTEADVQRSYLGQNEAPLDSKKNCGPALGADTGLLVTNSLG
jgi:hypothetical protein